MSDSEILSVKARSEKRISPAEWMLRAITTLRSFLVTSVRAVSARPLWGSVVTGILLGFSFPPFDLPILQYPAWVLLLNLLSASPDRRTAYLRLTVAFGIWNLSTTYWLMMATVSGGVAALVANTLLMGLPALLLREVLRRSWSTGLEALSIAGIWTSFEFFHHHWDLSWPWLTLGNAWSVWPSWIQWISITGHLGISFWVVGLSVIVFRWVESRETQTGVRRRNLLRPMYALWLIPVLSVPISLGGADEVIVGKYGASQEAALEVPAQTGGEFVNILLVQPDQNSLLPNGGYPSLSVLVDELVHQTEATLTADTDLILWPENAVDGIVEEGDSMVRRLSDQSLRWNVPLITGTTYLDTYPNRPAPDVVRNAFRTRPYNIYNAALQFPGGVEVSTSQTSIPIENNGFSVYRKGNLVPIVERFPFIEVFLRIPGFSSLNWENWLGYGRGEEAVLFISKNGRIAAPLVCYDSVYPDWVRSFVNQGADVLTVITNDGWWGNTSGHIQHFEFARLRAIEFRRSVVRSANNGISGLIGPDGRVHEASEYGKADQFIVRAPVSTQLTFFARWGNWLGWFSVCIAVISLACLIGFKPLSSPIEKRA